MIWWIVNGERKRNTIVRVRILNGEICSNFIRGKKYFYDLRQKCHFPLKEGPVLFVSAVCPLLKILFAFTFFSTTVVSERDMTGRGVSLTKSVYNIIYDIWGGLHNRNAWCIMKQRKFFLFFIWWLLKGFCCWMLHRIKYKKDIEKSIPSEENFCSVFLNFFTAEQRGTCFTGMLRKALNDLLSYLAISELPPPTCS